MVNALAQGALRQFIQWPWIEHSGVTDGGTGVRVSPPGKLNTNNGSPFRDFLNFRIYKFFHGGEKSTFCMSLSGC